MHHNAQQSTTKHNKAQQVSTKCPRCYFLLQAPKSTLTIDCTTMFNGTSSAHMSILFLKSCSLMTSVITSINWTVIQFQLDGRLFSLGRANDFFMYPRYITQNVKEALTDTPVVFAMGPRQVGKTTLVKSRVGIYHPGRPGAV